MKLSKFQIQFIKKYNNEISEDVIKTEFKACLCGKENPKSFDKIYQKDRYGLWCPSVLCHSCGLIQLNPRLTASEYSSFYEEDKYRLLYGDKNYLSSYREKFTDPYNRHIFDILDPIMQESKLNNVLEFGCGGGWKLLPFHDADYDTTGYDFSSSLVELGKTYGLNLNQGSTEDIVGGPFDVIIVNHVAEHFTDFYKEMGNIIKHLRPNGILFVGVPNIDNFGKSQFQNAHILYFTPRTFKHYMSKLNMSAIKFGEVAGGHMYGVFKFHTVDAEEISLVNEYRLMKNKIFIGKFKSSLKSILEILNLK